MTEKEKEVEPEKEVKEAEVEKEKGIHVKFLINKEKTKVLFAEAGSDFVDILLSFLLLPLGTIVKVLKDNYEEKTPVIGSLSTLYDGVANLDSIHFLSENARSFLLNPTGHDDAYLPQYGGNFTESTASFVISDDLRVMPNVEGSVLSTLSSLGIAMTDMDGATTFDIDFGCNEILDLLSVIFTSRNPLTAYLLLRGGRRISRAAGYEKASINQISRKAVSMNSKKMIVKAMLQKSTRKLLFAQADDDFVSFLFGALALPLGRVEWYFHSNTGVRATDNLHKSLRGSLHNNHLMSPGTKDLLFKPALSNDDSSDGSASTDNYCRNEYSPLNFDTWKSQHDVRGSRMYMVRDDLTVSPLSITSSVSVIKEMEVALSDVEELELQVGLEEGLSILRAALTSTTALSDGLAS